MSYYIKVFDATNPTSYELSHCKNVKQRLKVIRQNIIAVQSTPQDQLPDWANRWVRFKDSDLTNIQIEIFLKKTNQDLFGNDVA